MEKLKCPSHNCCKVGKLWVPYIIFRNTDSDEAVTVNGDTMTLVSVTKEGGFVRSGPEVADEVLYRLISHSILPWANRVQ